MYSLNHSCFPRIDSPYETIESEQISSRLFIFPKFFFSDIWLHWRVLSSLRLFQLSVIRSNILSLKILFVRQWNGLKRGNAIIDKYVNQYFKENNGIIYLKASYHKKNWHVLTREKNILTIYLLSFHFHKWWHEIHKCVFSVH